MRSLRQAHRPRRLSAPFPQADPPVVRVAVDLLGGDRAPEQVVDGALLATREQPGSRVVLVGPPDLARRLLVERGATGAVEVVPAAQVVGMHEDPARAVLRKPDSTVQVAARLVRDGGVDAMVTVGSTGAAVAAGLLTLGRLRGIARPALAAVVPAQAGPLVLLDVGATVDPSAPLLAQHALVGAALARVRLGIVDPRVGLLTIGEESGKGDALRRSADALLAALPVRYVGSVEGRDVPYGGRADVVVTDGFTGNVLVKGLEGAAGMLTDLLAVALAATAQGGAVPGLLTALDAATAHLSPDALGGGMLVGVGGVCVVGHGAASARAVASCIAVAAQAVRDRLVPRTAAALQGLVAVREEAAPVSGARP